MIWDACIWKNELAQDLQRMRKRLMQFQLEPEGAFESTSMAIDKFVFTSAFITRKLSEAQKLSDELESTPLPVLKHPRINAERPIHPMNWHRLDQFYDLEKCETTTMLPLRLCNLLIHSFVFMPGMDQSGERFETILFNSDRTKACLFEIDLQTYFRFVESVCNDDIVSSSWSVDQGFILKSRNDSLDSSRE